MYPYLLCWRHMKNSPLKRTYSYVLLSMEMSLTLTLQNPLDAALLEAVAKAADNVGITHTPPWHLVRVSAPHHFSRAEIAVQCCTSARPSTVSSTCSVWLRSWCNHAL